MTSMSPPDSERETLEEDLLRGFVPIGAVAATPLLLATPAADTDTGKVSAGLGEVSSGLGEVAAEATEAIAATSAFVAAAGNGTAAEAAALHEADVVVSSTSLPATDENTSSQMPPWAKRTI